MFIINMKLIFRIDDKKKLDRVMEGRFITSKLNYNHIYIYLLCIPIKMKKILPHYKLIMCK